MVLIPVARVAIVPGRPSTPCRAYPAPVPGPVQYSQNLPEDTRFGEEEKGGQAVSIRETSSSLSSRIEISRIMNFWIFPVTLIGNSVTNFTYCGIL